MPAAVPVDASIRARLDWVDAARGISIALIVLMHARLVLNGIGIDAGALTVVDDVAGHLRIPLFFAASGLLAARWATASWRELFRGRLSLLLWVFIVWQPVVLTYKLAEWWLLRDQLDERWAWQIGQLLLSPVRPVGELWFLWALCVFLVLSRLTGRVPVALRVGIPAAVSFVWTAFVEPELGSEIREVLGAGWGGVAKYYVFFVAAATFSGRIRALFSAVPRWVAALVFLGWLTLTILAIESGIEVRWVRFLLFAGGAAAGFALGRVLSPIAPLRALGRNTLPVYVAHLAIIVGTAVVLNALALAPVLDVAPVVAVAGVAVLAIILALLLHRALERTRAGRLMYAPPAWFRAPATSGVRPRTGRTRRR
jgi:uncharacterized membrane protein YcfT